MAKKDQMICTEKQRDALEKLFAEILVGGNFRESNCCLENMCLCKAAKSWIFGGILYLQYKCMPKSSSDFISATERFSDEPRLVKACNTSFGTVTKTSQDALLKQTGNFLVRSYLFRP